MQAQILDPATNTLSPSSLPSKLRRKLRERSKEYTPTSSPLPGPEVSTSSSTPMVALGQERDTLPLPGDLPQAPHPFYFSNPTLLPAPPSPVAQQPDFLVPARGDHHTPLPNSDSRTDTLTDTIILPAQLLDILRPSNAPFCGVGPVYVINDNRTFNITIDNSFGHTHTNSGPGSVTVKRNHGARIQQLPPSNTGLFRTTSN